MDDSPPYWCECDLCDNAWWSYGGTEDGFMCNRCDKGTISCTYEPDVKRNTERLKEAVANLHDAESP